MFDFSPGLRWWAKSGGPVLSPINTNAATEHKTQSENARMLGPTAVDCPCHQTSTQAQPSQDKLCDRLGGLHGLIRAARVMIRLVAGQTASFIELRREQQHSKARLPTHPCQNIVQIFQSCRRCTSVESHAATQPGE